MKPILWLIVVGVCLLAGSAAAQSDRAVVVGRITEITGGELLRYDVEAGEWVALVPDSPFGINDALYTDEHVRAEIFIPNGTLVRLDGYTQIQNLSLDERLTKLHLSNGLCRVVSRDNGAEIEVLTGFGRILVSSGGAADIAVDAQRTTVTAVADSVRILTATGETYRIAHGDALALTGGAVTSIAGSPAPTWADWNRQRDLIWAARTVNAASARYLPASLAPYAYDLDAYGQWRSVSYAGAYRRLWCPIQVTAGWSPYTYGRWVTWYGDPCWIPAEPFGYVTHHYGSWEFIGGLWFWVPPGLGITVSPGEGWYPGRVGWISYGSFIGWYPLLWSEPWYAHRNWGPRSDSSSRYRYDRHHHAVRAVVVDRRHFYQSRSYAEHRHRHVELQRFKRHRGPHELPSLNGDRRRFHAKGVPAVRAPHPAVTTVVRRTIETKLEQPTAFLPSTVEERQRPLRTATTVAGPLPASEPRSTAPPMTPTAHSAPDPPDRSNHQTPSLRQRNQIAAPPAPQRQIQRPAVPSPPQQPAAASPRRQNALSRPAGHQRPTVSPPTPQRQIQRPAVPSPPQQPAAASPRRQNALSRPAGHQRPTVSPPTPQQQIQRPAVPSPPPPTAAASSQLQTDTSPSMIPKKPTASPPSPHQKSQRPAEARHHRGHP